MSKYFVDAFNLKISSFNRNEYNSLHEKYRPLNLGHGFTDYEVPKHITDALIAVTEDPDYFLNQYARGFVSFFSRLSTSIDMPNRNHIYFSKILGSSTACEGAVCTLFQIM